MSSKIFLARQLKETAQIIEWAVKLVPKDRLLDVPPHSNHPKASEGMKTYFGLWSAYRLLFHLTFYEENYALPTMKHWLDAPHPDVDIIFPNMEVDEEAWKLEIKNGINLQALLNVFTLLEKSK